MSGAMQRPSAMLSTDMWEQKGTFPPKYLDLFESQGKETCSVPLQMSMTAVASSLWAGAF